MQDNYVLLQVKTPNTHVSCVVDTNGELIAKVVFIFSSIPRGEGNRCECFLHVIGSPMARGEAYGGNYDMRTTAFIDACKNLTLREGGVADKTFANFKSLKDMSDSETWTFAVRNHGYKIHDII